MKVRSHLPLALLLALAGCNLDSTGSDVLVLENSFETAPNGWTSGFADYPAGEEEFYELASAHRALPAPLDTTRKALYLSGNNHSDDLFMFLKREVSGLEPGTTYTIHYEVLFASNAPSGCVGVGGSPGEAVRMVATASTTEPKAVLENGYYRMNVDKGNQGNGGGNVVEMGHVGTGSSNCHDPVFKVKTLASPTSVTATTDASGKLWLLLGTDSGFESTTSLYYVAVRAVFDPK